MASLQNFNLRGESESNEDLDKLYRYATALPPEKSVCEFPRCRGKQTFHPLDRYGKFFRGHTAFIQANGSQLPVRVLSLVDHWSLGRQAQRPAQPDDTVDVPPGGEAQVFPHIALRRSPPMAVARVACAWIKTDPADSSQTRSSCLEKLKWLMRYDSLLEREDWPLPRQLPIYFRLLDEVFFAGLLHDHVEVNMLSTANNFLEQGDVLGMSRGRAIEDPTVRIAIRNMARREPKDPKAKRLVWLGTMLHEMVHALFMVYGCRCQSCRVALGYTGHGLAWHVVARCVNDFLRKHIDLERPPYNQEGFESLGEKPDDLGIRDSARLDFPKADSAGNFDTAMLQPLPNSDALYNPLYLVPKPFDGPPLKPNEDEFDAWALETLEWELADKIMSDAKLARARVATDTLSTEMDWDPTRGVDPRDLVLLNTSLECECIHPNDLDPMILD